MASAQRMTRTKDDGQRITHETAQSALLGAGGPAGVGLWGDAGVAGGRCWGAGEAVCRHLRCDRLVGEAFGGVCGGRRLAWNVLGGRGAGRGMCSVGGTWTGRAHRD